MHPNPADLRLTDLPEELLTNISGRLSSDDVFALRLCSRTAEHKTFHEFATRFFTAKCIHFTTDSLRCLLEISKSRLADYVKSVSVMVALFSELSFACPGKHSHWHPTVRQSEAFRYYITDQKQLKESGRDMNMLVGAFKALKSVTSVAMIDNPVFKGDEVDYRGFWKVTRLTGTYPVDGTSCSEKHHKTPEYRQWLTHVWLVLLRALASSRGQIKLNEFKTEITFPENGLYPRQLNLTSSTSSKLADVLASTTKLQLHLKGYKTIADTKKYGDGVAKFAGMFPNLNHISLVFDNAKHTGHTLRRLLSTVNCENLKHFEINGLHIDAQHLTKIFARFTKIQHLLLTGIDLTSGSWPAVLKAIAKLETVDHLHLRYLKEAGGKAYFRAQLTVEEFEAREAREATEAGVPYTGHHEDDEDNDAFIDIDDDDGSSTDDDLPDLEPVGGDTQDPAGLNAATAQSAGPSPTHNAKSQDETAEATEPMDDYVPPTYSVLDFGDRGFFVCVSGHQRIMRELKVFIKEYNAGAPFDDFDGPLAGLPPGALPIAFGGGVAGGPGGGPPGMGGLPFNLPPGVLGGGAGGHGPPPGGPPGAGAGAFNTIMSMLMGGGAGHGPPHHHQPHPPTGAHAPAANPAASSGATATTPATTTATPASAAATSATAASLSTATPGQATAGAADDAFTDGDEDDDSELSDGY